MSARLEASASSALGARAVRTTRVSGGDVNEAYRVELADGRVVFAKTHARAPEGMYAAEGFSARVFSSYAETHPLAPGHEERVGLYQLYPLLVHVALFGASYLEGVDRILRTYG